jgi:hypothetical protein
MDPREPPEPRWQQFIVETDKCRNNIAEYKEVLLGPCKL